MENLEKLFVLLSGIFCGMGVMALFKDSLLKYIFFALMIATAFIAKECF